MRYQISFLFYRYRLLYRRYLRNNHLLRLLLLKDLLVQASGVPAGISPAQFNWTPTPGGLRLRLPAAGLDFTLPTAALAEVLRPEFLAQLRAFRLHKVEG